jgi:hypothetical protein
MTVAESGSPKYTVWNVAIPPRGIAIIHTKVLRWPYLCETALMAVKKVASELLLFI